MRLSRNRTTPMRMTTTTGLARTAVLGPTNSVTNGAVETMTMTTTPTGAGKQSTDPREALRALLEHYVQLVNCGDCGNWNPEEEAVVIAARVALLLAEAAPPAEERPMETAPRDAAEAPPPHMPLCQARKYKGLTLPKFCDCILGALRAEVASLKAELDKTQRVCAAECIERDRQSDRETTAEATLEEACDHGVSFDEPAARGLPVLEVRTRWPRGDGPCPKGCGFNGVAYANWAHYMSGDW